MAGPEDLIRQLMAQSGASGSNYKLPVPAGMDDLRQRMLATDPRLRTLSNFSDLGAMPYAGDAAPGDMSSLFGSGAGTGAPQQQQPMRLPEIKTAALDVPKTQPEDMFSLDTNLKVKAPPDSRDEAIRKAREALERAGAAAKTPPAPTDAAAVKPPTPETPSQFEGQHTQNAPANSAEFVKMFTPIALQIAAETGLDPRLVLAQAAHESGWGAHAPQFNYFGIKGKGQTLDTTEEVDGKIVKTKADFRAYKSADEAAKDYIKFIKENPRYAALLKAKGLGPQLQALGASGYATDSKYAQKVAAIAAGLPSIEPLQSEPDTRARGGPIHDLLATARNYR